MGVSDIFVFVADAIYDYALAADTLHYTDDDDEDEEEGEFYPCSVCLLIVCICV